MPTSTALERNDELATMLASDFLRHAEGAVRFLGHVLSVSVLIPPTQLIEIARRASGQEDIDPNSLSELREWPFVVVARSGWSMQEDVARRVAEGFREEDPALFLRIHEELVAYESETDDNDLYGSWFVRGRIAFYLAGVNPAAAQQRFGTVFDSAPEHDRTAARLWLSHLAIRQEFLLPDSRVAEFFRGFRYYVTGAHTEARKAFSSVLRGDVKDVYAAISHHLHVLTDPKRQSSDSAVKELRRSIKLSIELDLAENEIMARNSLVLARASQLAVQHHKREWVKTEIKSILELAEKNVERAEHLGSPYFIAWCTHTAAAMHWKMYVGPRMRWSVSDEARSLAPSILERLESAIDLALQVSDLGTALVALNTAALMQIDLGEYRQSFETLKRAASLSSEFWDSPRILDNLAKTSRRLERRSDEELLGGEIFYVANQFRTMRRESQRLRRPGPALV